MDFPRTPRWLMPAVFALLIASASCGSGTGPSDSPTTVVEPTPTSTSDQIVGVRGAAGLGDPVFPLLGNGGYDVSHYDLGLTIDVNANTLDAVATINAVATANLLAFNLDYAGPEVSEVQVNDEPATFSREDFELVIEPATVILNGSEFIVRVLYGGTPEPLFLPGFPIPMGWTTFRNAVVVHGMGFAWYPKNHTNSDKATYNVKFTVPKPLIATASGDLVTTIDNGDTATYVWELTVPSAEFRFSVSNSALESIPGPDGLAINNYFPGGISQYHKDRLAIAPDVIEFFIDLFGPFPYESFGTTFLEVNLPRPGFASPQRVFLVATGEGLIAHEIAHEWFGASVSAELLSDNWLVEGFATYAALLWLEHTDGAEAYADGARSLRHRTGLSTRSLAIANSPADLIDPAAYDRGALTLHALRLELGDNDFFEVIRVYLDRFKYSSASTADFITVAEEVSQQDLRQFFDDWVYSEPVPSIEP